MTITTNIEKTARAARQTAEMQRNSYEAMAKNISTLQRRNVELAQMWMTGGFELMRAYQSFFSPFSYAQQGLKVARQATEHAQQEMQATQQELRLAEQPTAKTAKTEQTTAKTTAKTEPTAKAEQTTAKTGQTTA